MTETAPPTVDELRKLKVAAHGVADQARAARAELEAAGGIITDEVLAKTKAVFLALGLEVVEQSSDFLVAFLVSLLRAQLAPGPAEVAR